MAHSLEEQQYLLARDRIRDGELPFLKTTFEGDGWLQIFEDKETYLMMACYYRLKRNFNINYFFALRLDFFSTD